MKINSTVEEWLANCGVPIADTASGVELDEDTLKYPFIVFTDIKNYDGADELNLFVRHSVYIYYYSESGNDNRIEAWLNSQNIKFSCDKSFIEEDTAYEYEYAINEDIYTKL